jgi:hypothetical protein
MLAQDRFLLSQDQMIYTLSVGLVLFAPALFSLVCFEFHSISSEGSLCSARVHDLRWRRHSSHRYIIFSTSPNARSALKALPKLDLGPTESQSALVFCHIGITF